MKKIIIAAALFAATAQASQTACFESDKVDEATRTQWSHQYFVADLGPIHTGPAGRKYRWATGYGFNLAGDLVPFTGSAVKNNAGAWIVSIVGTLRQHSTYMLHDDVPELRYWIISQQWEFEPGKAVTGTSHQGNLIEPFGEAFPVTHDDSFVSYLWRVSCDQLPQ